MSLQGMILNDWDDVAPEARCPNCGRRALEGRLNPGHYYLPHRGDCPFNDALYPCERCGFTHGERGFGQVLACIMDVPLEEGRAMQKRILDRVLQ